jgi:hypothetical protein
MATTALAALNAVEIPYLDTVIQLSKRRRIMVGQTEISYICNSRDNYNDRPQCSSVPSKRTTSVIYHSSSESEVWVQKACHELSRQCTEVVLAVSENARDLPNDTETRRAMDEVERYVDAFSILYVRSDEKLL